LNSRSPGDGAESLAGSMSRMQWPRYRATARELAVFAALAASLIVAVAISDDRQWQPTTLVAALAVVMVLADVAVVWARKLRVSPGLMVQTTLMALLGPSPAVVLGVFSISLVDGVIYRLGLVRTGMNLMTVAVLGLAGGALFEFLRTQLGVSRDDTEYAALVLPVYVGLAFANLAVISAAHPLFGPGERIRLFRESGVPSLPLELLNGMFAATAVFLWAQGGHLAAAGLLAVLVVLIPLTRSVMEGVTSSDDLITLKQVSDARAAEVARLASDRERLLSEVLDAEERERARLAESLHDGPMQRLVALRQDAADPDSQAVAMISGLSEAITETRAIISSLHPATVRELGFEASLRAAIAPFPTARSVSLEVRSAVDEQTLAATLPLRIAQELVVNAVKHACPTRIEVCVSAQGQNIVLEVNDDGVGIDTSDASRAVQAGHVGLATVRRRVEDRGGQFDIETREDGGTRSRVALPLERS
jgi:signal transduction histidine kinase